MTGPYAQAADRYWQAGWRGILPLPAGAKTWPPKGYTGDHGTWPSYPDIRAWADGREAAGNIALRLPPGVVGIDVDAYGDKPGAQTLTLAETEHGPLPATWRTTSRDDGVSGIRLYRVPEGLAWPGEIGPAVDIIQTGHRYAVVWPSTHPEGRTYRWIDPSGVVSTAIPDPDELPPLPDTWVQAYTGGVLHQPTARTDIAYRDALGWIAGLDHATEPMCQRMQRAVDQHAQALPGGAHAATRDAALRIARLAAEGHHGPIHAIGRIKDSFIADATSPSRALLGKARRGDDEAEHEWASLVASAVGVVLADPSEINTCDCYGQLTGVITATGTVVVDGTTALEPAPILEVPTPAERPAPAAPAEAGVRFRDGASFILDAPTIPPSIWGKGQECLWAEGESLMIVGPPGVGKTTITGQILRGLLGLQRDVLGLPVRPAKRHILYLAMDRPAQIARALRRAFKEHERAVLEEKLLVWEGPPPGDVAKNPDVLLTMAKLADADVLIVDSVKDAALRLSEDEVGASYNRARQTCLAAGVQMLELHHMVKRGPSGAEPKELADVYGSAWLTAGAGSVVSLWGAAGDENVKMSHLKQPAETVGPFTLKHDHEHGITVIEHDFDYIVFVAAHPDGVTAKQVARAHGETDEPVPREVEAERRRLDKLVREGLLDMIEQPRGIGSGGKPLHVYFLSDSSRNPNHETQSRTL